MSFDFIDLNWDTNYFKVKSGKLILNHELKLPELKDSIELTNSYDFITIINKNNLSKNNFLLGKYTSAFLVDMNIQFEMKVESNKGRNYFNAKNNFEENIELLKIAKHSFNFSRFYNDPYLDKELGQQIYFNWIKNSFNKKEKYFIVAKENDQTLGYILFSIDSSSDVTIELISLAKEAQGKGTGTKLLSSLNYFAEQNNIHKIKVGTQIDNIQATNFYMKKGFSLTSISSIYHFWPRKERLND